jgi:hypothetical protein
MAKKRRQRDKPFYETLHRKLKIGQHEFYTLETGNEPRCSGRAISLLACGQTRSNRFKNAVISHGRECNYDILRVLLFPPPIKLTSTI